MTDENSRPSSPNLSAHDVEALKGGEEANASSDRAGDEDALAFINRTLGRSYDSIEEAGKGLENLQSMVGDRSIAELRTKAELGDAFETLVSEYAGDYGMSYEDARAELMSLAGGEESASTGDQGGSTKLAEIEQRLDRQDLLSAHPEAKNVMEDLQALAYAKGMSLQEAYESSQALQAAARSLASSSDRNSRSSVLSPSQRIAQAAPNRGLSEAVANFKASRSGAAADELVAKALFSK